MSEFGPTPEDAEKEAKGMAIAKEIATLRSRARTDSDYEVILQKTFELKGIFGITSESALEGEIAEQIEKAKEILGNDCLGPNEVKKAFGIEIKSTEVPSIPFSAAELEKAKSLGQFLVLRVNHDLDGSPLTMQRMEGLLKTRYESEDEKVLYDTDWYESEKFFTEETPEMEWALTSKEVIPDSTDKNYLHQTDTLKDYLNQVFPEGLPAEYQEAVQEFTSQRDEIERLISDDWKEAAARLEALKITQLTRKTPVETLYDLLMYHQNNGERPLENMYSWTNRRYSGGRLVYVGFFESVRVFVPARGPDSRSDGLGVSFSRSR